MSTTAQASGNGQATQLLPFLAGSRQIWKKVCAIQFVDNTQAATQKINKAGFIGCFRMRFAGAANVTAAGSAGAPSLWKIVKQYKLSLSGNYEYRNLRGESIYVLDAAREVNGALDPMAVQVLGATFAPSGTSIQYQTYNPASATNQSIAFSYKDKIFLNQYDGADEFLLAAQARNYDLYLDILFETASNIRANTETVAFSGTLFVEGLYQLDADYTKFAPPDLTKVQQIVDDWSFTAVQQGDNVVPVNPINGPEYMQIFFQAIYNSAIDLPGPASASTNLRLRVNNAQDIFDIPTYELQSENQRFLGRALPLGYYMLDFLNDMGNVDQSSPLFTRLISTATLNSFELILTTAQGTTVTNSNIKLIKRLRTTAVA